MLKFFNLKQINAYLKVLMLIALFGGTLLAVYTLHDFQTAEGAGLYLSIAFQHSSRTFFDIIVDLTGMLLLFLVILLPTILLKHKSLESFFRLFATYLAFMPIVHPGSLVHLINTFKNINIRSNILNCNLGEVLTKDLAPVFNMLQIFLPFLLLLYALNKTLQIEKKPLPKWFMGLLLVFLLCFCLFENVDTTFLYLAYYFLILWCFQEWEALCKSFPRFAVWSNILFFGCLLRGIYRMLELISTTHM